MFYLATRSTHFIPQRELQKNWGHGKPLFLQKKDTKATIKNIGLKGVVYNNLFYIIITHSIWC